MVVGFGGASNGFDGDDGAGRFVDLDDFDGSTRRHRCESPFLCSGCGMLR